MAARDQFGHYEGWEKVAFWNGAGLRGVKKTTFLDREKTKLIYREWFCNRMHRFCTRCVQKMRKKLEIAITREWMELGEIWNHLLVCNFSSSTSLLLLTMAKFWLQVRLFGTFWNVQILQNPNGARYGKTVQTTFVDPKNTRTFYISQFFDSMHCFCARGVWKCWKLCIFRVIGVEVGYKESF